MVVVQPNVACQLSGTDHRYSGPPASSTFRAVSARVDAPMQLAGMVDVSRTRTPASWASAAPIPYRECAVRRPEAQWMPMAPDGGDEDATPRETLRSPPRSCTRPAEHIEQPRRPLTETGAPRDRRQSIGEAKAWAHGEGGSAHGPCSSPNSAATFGFSAGVARNTFLASTRAPPTRA